MPLIKKEIQVEANIGDIIKAPNTVYREDITLYICHIEGDLLYISDSKNTPKDECESTFAEDCYLVKRANGQRY